MPRLANSNPCMSAAFLRMPARLGPLRTVRQRTGFFEGCQRFGFQIESGLWVFDRSSHGTELFGRCWMIRLPRLASCPAQGSPFMGIAGLNSGFGVGASRAFVAAMLEPLRLARNGDRHHPRLAVGAARTVDWQQLWIGFRRPGHDGTLVPSQSGCLSGARPKSQKAWCRSCRCRPGGGWTAW
jgi:hypothetical protein